MSAPGDCYGVLRWLDELDATGIDRLPRAWWRSREPYRGWFSSQLGLPGTVTRERVRAIHGATDAADRAHIDALLAESSDEAWHSALRGQFAAVVARFPCLAIPDGHPVRPEPTFEPLGPWSMRHTAEARALVLAALLVSFGSYDEATRHLLLTAFHAGHNATRRQRFDPLAIGSRFDPEDIGYALVGTRDEVPCDLGLPGSDWACGDLGHRTGRMQGRDGPPCYRASSRDVACDGPAMFLKECRRPSSYGVLVCRAHDAWLDEHRADADHWNGYFLSRDPSSGIWLWCDHPAPPPATPEETASLRLRIRQAGPALPDIDPLAR